MKKIFSFSLLVTLALNGLFSVNGQNSSSSDPAVEQRVESLLGKMSLEEKIDMLGGVEGFYIRAVPRLGIPKMKMADGPAGVRNYGPATTFAAGIGLTASWNADLARRVGEEIGRDARARGVHFMLGPGVNIYRAPMNGRNFEYFGEDPFLASRVAVGYIEGIQSQGVSATIKHFVANNSEFLRHDSDSIVDERTLREIYLPVFEAAVKEAKVGAIMDSYNFINGEHASQNSHINNDIAKKDWGFDGLIMSDWFSTYDGVAAANGGLDLEMPAGANLNRQILLPAVKAGKVSEATIDDKVRRILRTAIRFGWLDRDQTDNSISLYNQTGRQVALETARESLVLLKNENDLLPIDKTKMKTVAVIGPNAYPAVPMGGGSGRVEPFAGESYLKALSDYLGAGVNVTYARGIADYDEMADSTDFTSGENAKGLKGEYFNNDKLEGTPFMTQTEMHINFSRQKQLPDKTASSRWTGSFTPKKAGEHEIFVQSSGEDGGFFRLFVDDKPVFDNWKNSNALLSKVKMDLDARPHKIRLEQRGRSFWLGTKLKFGIIPTDGFVKPEALALAAKADRVVLAVGFDHESESEGADRTFALPPGQDELIEAVAAANKNTMVVMNSGGAVDMRAWLDRVPVVIEAWYPGQEGGTALAEILTGAVNPSGKLPVSFERRWEDNPVSGSYYLEPDTNRIVYKEGVFVGYRGYEKNKTKPLFPFGYGLSYTSFAYGNLSVERSGETVEVSFDVKNTGNRAGAEIAQVYVGDSHSKVERPLKELKGFAKVFLNPNETKRVSVKLDRRAFAYYDVSGKDWRVDPGEFEILVGSSSEKIELRGKVNL